LIRRRALLLDNAYLSMVADAEPELRPDPIDQALTEFEQKLAMQVRTRTFDKLRRIEQALQLMRTSGYGRCRRGARRRFRTSGSRPSLTRSSAFPV
jgi:RNA polymerase-binding transcription factor DksA